MSVFITFLIIGLFQALLLIFAIVHKKRKRLYPLLVLLIIVAIGLGFRIAYSPQFYADWVKFVQLSDITILLFGPAFLFFIRSVIKPANSKDWKALWPHLIPSFLFIAHFCWRILPVRNSSFLQAELAGAYSFYYTLLLGTGIVLNAFYAYRSLLKLRQYHGPANSRKFLYLVLGINAFTLLSWLVAYLLSITGVESAGLMNLFYQVAFITLSATCIAISYHALTNKDFWIPKVTAKKYAKSRLSTSDLGELGNRLQRHMVSQKAYLSQNLSLNDLSAALRINKVELSQVINQHLGKGFADWVNEYRVEEFISRVESDQYLHLTFMGIAMESGFNTKATFNKAFKKIKGSTPSSYFAKKNREESPVLSNV